MALFEPKLATTHVNTVKLWGQGAVVASFQRCTPFAIRIRPTQVHGGYMYEESETVKDKFGYVEVQVRKDKAIFKIRTPGHKNFNILHGTSSTDERGGLEPGKKVSYWLSFNRNERILKYGKGYIMEDTTLLTERFPFPETKERDPWNFIFRPDTCKEIVIKDLKCTSGWEILRNFFSFGRDLKRVTPQNDAKVYDSFVLKKQKSVTFYHQPLTQNWSPFVVDSSKASLVDLSSNKYMLSASLPATCRELYENVMSGNMSLDWPHSTPKLSEAINYSINTKGKLLYEKLKEKDHGNGMSYLRVTIGCYHGSSPGIPYVLEIWPAKSQSPIHNHGNSYAVIKVLHGAIKVSNYNKTWKDEESQQELSSFTATKGDVTWMSPNWFQTHKLTNESSDQFCATIQCYKYGIEDEQQWPYFNYLDGETLQEFLPNSDFDFNKLREELLKEYNLDHRTRKDASKGFRAPGPRTKIRKALAVAQR